MMNSVRSSPVQPWASKRSRICSRQWSRSLSVCAGDRPFMNAEQVGHLALAHAIPQPQAEDQQLGVGQRTQCFAGGLAKGFMPSTIRPRRQRQGDIVVRQGMNAAGRTQPGNVGVLKDANEPGHERTLTIVAGQHGQPAGRLADKQLAPETRPPRFPVARRPADRSEPPEPAVRPQAGNRCGRFGRRRATPTPGHRRPGRRSRDTNPRNKASRDTPKMSSPVPYAETVQTSGRDASRRPLLPMRGR